ncbi:hypothetical protein IIC38_08240, partial [candidate division KSB1 bacterium]|nr:hypothetical protein [candidate division KSB1 bacterium]
MNLKEKIENHLVIVVVVMFGAGASLAWFVANEVLVRPRDFTIQQQKETIAELREKIKQQMTSTEKIGKDQKETLEAELRPFLIRLFINQPTTKEVGLWIENHGKGVAHLMPYDIVINGDIKSKHNIRTLADWQTVL